LLKFILNMLQRIQTVWMILALIAAILFYVFVPTLSFIGEIPWDGIITVLLVVLGLFSIFGYKNRRRQILLNRVCIILNALLICLLVYWLLNLSGEGLLSKKGIELAFPIFAIVALFIANHRIRKDEKLVKSVDRFR